MKKLLVVLGMSVVAMAGKCGSSDADKSGASSEKPAEEFPAKEEVPSYDQQGAAPTEATPAPSETVTTPSETAPAATDAGKVPSND